MDMNEYVITQLVHSRLEEMRAEARRAHLATEASPPRPMRVTLGLGLIRLGQLLTGGVPRSALRVS